MSTKPSTLPSSRPSLDEIERVLHEAEAFGIDLSLLAGNLHLTPTQRLEKLEGVAELVYDLRAAVQQAR